MKSLLVRLSSIALLSFISVVWVNAGGLEKPSCLDVSLEILGTYFFLLISHLNRSSSGNSQTGSTI